MLGILVHHKCFSASLLSQLDRTGRLKYLIYLHLNIGKNVFFYKELFHASQWHNDTRFYSPMASLSDGTHAFIHDCVRCKHPQFDVVTCIVTKYFMMVNIMIVHIHSSYVLLHFSLIPIIGR